MTSIIAKTAFVLAIAFAPVQSENAANVAGKWTMTVKSPHGVVTMTLALQQDGKKVTGTFITPHGDMRVDGDFADGTLKLATPNDGDSRITLTAKTKSDGTLDGYLSSQIGDMTWTAERVKDK
ncbi:MAG TPA: hypothetical protein VH740_16030 [Vicinamibacterales bacterium]|jgi:hypothetical protein